MKNRLIAAALATAALGSMSLGAYAAPGDPEEPLQVSTQGSAFQRDVEAPVILTPPAVKTGNPYAEAVFVPGDVLNGTVTWKNSGNVGGYLSVYILKPNTVTPEEPDKLWEDITFNGTSGKELIDSAKHINEDYEGTLVETVFLEPGATHTFDVTAQLPFEAESGNKAGYNATSETLGGKNQYMPGYRNIQLDLYAVINGESPKVEPVKPADPETPKETPAPVKPSTPQAVTPPTQDTPKQAETPKPKPETPKKTEKQPEDKKEQVKRSKLPRTGDEVEVSLYAIGAATVVGLGLLGAANVSKRNRSRTEK